MIGIPKEIINWLLEQDKEKKFEIKEHKEKRSLDANGYSWLLMEKIAKVVGTSKDEIYENMLSSYGTFRKDTQDKMLVIPTPEELKSTDKLHLKFVGRKQVNDKILNLYAIIKGSSEYDKSEMSSFIDGVVSEAKELDIETMTTNEIANLKSQWNNNEKV